MIDKMELKHKFSTKMWKLIKKRGISGISRKVFHRKVENIEKMLINTVFLLFSSGEKVKIVRNIKKQFGKILQEKRKIIEN